MRKTLLVFLTILFVAPLLSGCFYYPYRDGWDDGGYRHGRGYYGDRGYEGRRDGSRDYDSRGR